MSLWEAVGVHVAAYTLLLSEAVRRSPVAYLSPLGVGAFDLSDQGAPRGDNQIGLYLEAALFGRSSRPGWHRLSEIPAIREQLQADFSASGADYFLQNGWALIASGPILQVAAGSPFLTNASVGTFGSEVTWTSSYGLLTAGHVGGVGAAVSVLNPAGTLQQIGTVVFSRTAAGAGPQGDADVAIIELNFKPVGNWGGLKTRTLQPLDDVDVLCSTGKATAQTKGMFAWLAYPGTNIVFANTYMTDKAITVKGDSGARATHANSGDLVGHVVGATTKVASYVQEIDYQLKAIKTQSQFSNIAV